MQETRSGGTYEIVLEPGNYSIQIIKQGFVEFRGQFQANKGTNVFAGGRVKNKLKPSGLNKLKFEIQKASPND